MALLNGTALFLTALPTRLGLASSIQRSCADTSNVRERDKHSCCKQEVSTCNFCQNLVSAVKRIANRGNRRTATGLKSVDIVRDFRVAM